MFTSKKRFVFGVFLTLILAVPAQAKLYKPLIHGGEKVQSTDPVAASTVAIGGPHGMHCSGTIIADDLVLTAAHCIKGIEATKIYFGTQVENAVEVAPIEASSYHNRFTRRPSYDNRDEFDIGLIHFTGGLPSGFRPVSLPHANFALTAGDQVTLAGFGMDRRDQSGTLKKVELEVSRAEWGETEMMVRQDTRNGACNGDSGGPAFVSRNGEQQVVGVANRVGNADCDHFVIYAKPHAYLSWLEKTASQLRNQENLFTVASSL